MKSKCEPLISLAVLFLVNVLNIYDRQVLSAVVEPLRRDFHLSDTQLGLLPALFTVLYAVAGLPLGRAVDTGSRRRLLASGIAVWAVLTALGAAAMSYGALLATRLGVGIGEAVCAPAATSWIADVVPAMRRARAMAGFMMAVPVGIMLSLAISGPVAQAYGWRAAMTASGGAGNGAGAGGAVAAGAGARFGVPAGGAIVLLSAAADFLVDRRFGSDRELSAVQLFLLPAGVPDARARFDRGTGRAVDRHRIGCGGNRGSRRGGTVR